MVIRRIGLMLLAASLVGCASAGKDIKAKALVNPKANLSGYQTYAWLGGIGELDDPSGTWKPVGFDADKEIRFLIDEQLRGKKMMFAGNDSKPDAYAMYMVMVDMNAQKDKIVEVFGEKADLENLTTGTLVVGLVDAETNKAIWAGAAMGQTLKSEQRTDEMVRARLAAGVEKIFAYYP